MTPEELEKLKAQVDAENAGVQWTEREINARRQSGRPMLHADDAETLFRSPIQGCIPQPPQIPSRDLGLIRAELVDALHDYAEIFREKAKMELQRAEAVDVVAAKIEAGGSAEQPDLATSQAFEREQHLLHMRFQELQMRVNRLILEHGNN